jgi:hypothetical protein
VSEKHGHRGKRHNLQNIEFIVEPRAITILPYKFIIRYTKPIREYISDGTVIFTVEADVVDIQRMTAEELGRLGQELGSYNNVELWERR